MAYNILSRPQSDKLYYDNNYKDALMRVYHQNKWKSPIYVTLKEDGASHLKRYTMAVLASNGKKLGFGVSNTKKHGEQKAAKMALILLDELNEDQYTERDKYYPDFLMEYEYYSFDYLFVLL